MIQHKPSQDAFVSDRQGRWQELDRILSTAPVMHKMQPADIANVGALYRAVCADLMRARGAGYTRELVAYLDALAARTHNALYRSKAYQMSKVWDLIARDFPRTVRESWRFMAAATALFAIPLAVALLATLANPEAATQILPKAQLEMLAQSYAEGFSSGRSEGEDAMMAGFYVYNNIGISFRVFATGIFFGLGSVFFLVFNGVMIGATLGYVINAGAGRNIVTFIMGHGAFELTAIVIAGAAGMRMGYSLVRTEGRTRLGSLRAQGPAVARLALGAAIMLAIAAAIEGFWSPSAVPDAIKWGTAGALWILVMVYLAVAGRRRAAA